MKNLTIPVTITIVSALSLMQLSANAQDTTKKDTTMQEDMMKNDTSAKAMGDTAASANDLSGIITANPEYSTLSKVIGAAGMEAALKGAGPLTVFAPINQGFVTLTQAGLDSLAKDTTVLKSVINYHVVKGSYTKDNILKALSSGKNTTTLTTLNGGQLTLTVNAEKNLEITDAKGNKALVTTFDQKAQNGVVHGINNVLRPK